MSAGRRVASPSGLMSRGAGKKRSVSVLFSCVAENRPEFATMAHNLAISIRSFAGELSEAPIVVNFVDDAHPTFVRSLEEIDAEVKIVERVSGGNPLANKLRILELDRDRDFDVLLALDCDVAVLGDPTPWLDTEYIGAKPADFDRFTDEEWRGLFAAAGVAEPQRVLTATATGQQIYPYFNSGVLFVPHALCGPLADAWMRMYRQLSTALLREPWLIREQWQWLAEQASLALGLIRDGLPWRALPPSLNFPSHTRVTSASSTPPVIVHYHGDLNEHGFLLKSASPSIDPWLDRFNRRRAELTGLPYARMPRRALHRRVQRAVARRVWPVLADRGWYRSRAGKGVRKAAKRFSARLGRS